MKECDRWQQTCTLLTDDQSLSCAKKLNVICFNVGIWKHYPDSPFGDVDMCPHGCCRPHNSKEKMCRICDKIE